MRRQLLTAAAVLSELRQTGQRWTWHPMKRAPAFLLFPHTHHLGFLRRLLEQLQFMFLKM